MKILPIASNKVRIEFEDGKIIDLYEGVYDTIRVGKEYTLRKWIGGKYYIEKEEVENDEADERNKP